MNQPWTWSSHRQWQGLGEVGGWRGLRSLEPPASSRAVMDECRPGPTSWGLQEANFSSAEWSSPSTAQLRQMGIMENESHLMAARTPHMFRFWFYMLDTEQSWCDSSTSVKAEPRNPPPSPKQKREKNIKHIDLLLFVCSSQEGKEPQDFVEHTVSVCWVEGGFSNCGFS